MKQLLWKVFQTKKKKKLDGQRLQTNLKERKEEKDTIPALSVSSIQESLMKKLNLIQNQPLLCQIFKEPPIICYKKGKWWSQNIKRQQTVLRR